MTMTTQRPLEMTPSPLSRTRILCSFSQAPVLSASSDVIHSDSGVNAPTEFEGGENSDAQLERDDKDAIDQSNIISDRTRGAAQPAGTYREPGDEEVCYTPMVLLCTAILMLRQGLPGPEDGTSST